MWGDQEVFGGEREAWVNDSKRERFLKVATSLAELRAGMAPTEEEAVFLGIVRDMAVHVSRGNEDEVWRLAREMGYEFGGVRRD